MIVHNDIQHLQAFKNAVITIGTFDGVHKGHQQIIELMKTESAKISGETVIISFNPHPRQIIAPGNTPVPLLNTLNEKTALLNSFGIDHLVIVPFTKKFAGQTAEDYIEHFLVNTFHPHTIIIGYDHKFGNNRSGDYKLLEQKAAQYNYVVKEIPVQMRQSIAISSTKIRASLLHGDVTTANSFLGYNYFFSGKVIEGNKLGRTIGFPTANLQPDDDNKLIPGNGVYAVKATIQKTMITYNGMMNIGIRPTINGTKRVIEVNIFDFDEDIYGEMLTVEVIKHLRSEVKFDGIELLKKQLAIDKENAVRFLNT